MQTVTEKWDIELADETATLTAGHLLAKTLHAGLTVYLIGELGAGKTTLSRGILRGLGHAGRVKSPTYTLVEPYTFAHYQAYHFDLYRFADPREWLDAGFDDYVTEHSLCLIEWPDKAAPLTPAADLELHLILTGHGRRLCLTALTKAGHLCLTQFLTLAAANSFKPQQGACS